MAEVNAWGADGVGLYRTEFFFLNRPALPTERPHRARRGRRDTVPRVRAYLRSVPPAVAGERGDAHTFRVCCRVVRGFALNADEALAALAEWNDRCESCGEWNCIEVSFREEISPEELGLSRAPVYTARV